jgi:hypothetical protein
MNDSSAGKEKGIDSTWILESTASICLFIFSKVTLEVPSYVDKSIRSLRRAPLGPAMEPSKKV